jgi:hypothetical protein
MVNVAPPKQNTPQRAIVESATLSFIASLPVYPVYILALDAARFVREESDRGALFYLSTVVLGWVIIWFGIGWLLARSHYDG